jgi:hypothetical protein
VNPFKAALKGFFISMKAFIYRNASSLSIAWALVVLASCAMPGQYIPSSDWLEMLSVDKLVHASLFFILISLMFVVAIKTHRNVQTYCIIFVGCVVYGVLLEIMQAEYFSNRSADWKDGIANSIGCIFGLLFLKKLKKIYQLP